MKKDKHLFLVLLICLLTVSLASTVTAYADAPIGGDIPAIGGDRPIGAEDPLPPLEPPHEPPTPPDPPEPPEPPHPSQPTWNYDWDDTGDTGSEAETDVGSSGSKAVQPAETHKPRVWLIILICVGSAGVLAGGAFAAVKLIRKRQESQWQPTGNFEEIR